MGGDYPTVNAVFIVPTGVGAEIGGHSGDATPAAKLIASVCDNLFVHPNVVNASDINEMTDNMLYVEGSILDRFLEGDIGLERVYQNKILLAVNAPVKIEIINAVSGARATIGADIEIVELEKPLRMVAVMSEGEATGDLYNVDEAVEQIEKHDFDVLVINTPIETKDETVLKYLREDGGINPWGGVEAKLSKEMSTALNRPVIHAPVENNEAFKKFCEVVDSRKAAEMVSVCYLHCCLKGAHVAPMISENPDAFWAIDIDFLITPVGVNRRPHQACFEQGIPIIAVEENKTALNCGMPDGTIFAKSYLEAAGMISAMEAGITLSSVRRPLGKTKIHGISFETKGEAR